MQHFVIDAFGGYRSRFDDIRLVNELMGELPHRLGLPAVMPPMLLPYYDGVVAEDCGISAFVFLAGGHFTLHTFSFREAYFADLVSPVPFDERRLRAVLDAALPCEQVASRVIGRHPDRTEPGPLHPDEDFGPHLFLDIRDYRGPATLDALFDVFDTLPASIGMTPIMRPYVVRGKGPDGEPILSAMTMIAESHISIHIRPERGEAHLDLFSCRFFDVEPVVKRLRRVFEGDVAQTVLFARGARYASRRTERTEEMRRDRAWLRSLPPSR